MGRKNRIIVSIVGIVIVLLTLVSITYGYYLTRIQGNTNSKSITVTTANLELLFDDSTPIINASNLKPIYEDDVSTKATKKTFTIDTLESTATQYITIKLTDLIIDEELANSSFKWVLYENGKWITSFDFDNIKTGQDVELIVNEKIEINTTKTYDLYIYIEESGQDQSDMMNKNFSAKVNLEGYSKPIVNTPENLLSSLELISGEYVNPNYGNIVSSTNAHKLYSHTDYIEVDNTKVLYFSGEYGDTNLSIAFYDENKTYISGVYENNNRNNYKVYDFNGMKFSGQLVEVPENARYYMFNVVTSYYQDENATLYYYYLIDKNITKEYNLPLNYETTTTLTNLNITNFGDSMFGNFTTEGISSYINTYYSATTYNVAVGGTRMSYHSSQNYNAFSMYNLADAITNNDYSLQESHIGSLSTAAKTNFNTLKTVDFNNVNYITIGFGTNDYASSVIIDNNNLDTNTYIGAARYSINKIRATYPNIKIILLTPIYRWWDESTDSNNRLNNNKNYLNDYGDALKKLQLEYSDNVYLYDGYNNLGIDITTRNIYFDSFDKTHINVFGRKLYAYKLGEYIKDLEEIE